MRAMSICALLGALAPAGVTAQPAEMPPFMDAATCYAFPFGLEQRQRDLFCETVTAPIPLAQRLTGLDAAIDALPARHPANAMLRSMKAQTLVGLGRRDEALAHVRNTMTAFPNLSPVWMQAIQMFAFTEQAEAAADFWIELARFDPAAARSIEEYHWLSLGPHLTSIGKWGKHKELAVALDAIGYDGGSEASRSLLAETLFRMNIERGDVAAGRVYLERVSNPAVLIDIMSNEQLRAVWDENPWADGARRATIVRRWIDDLGRAATADGLQAGNFLREAIPQGGPEPAIAAYEPVLRAQMARGTADADAFDFTYWLPPLAAAHMIAGRPERAEALYREALAYFATLDSPVRLNATSNYALFLQKQGRNQEALPLIEEAIEALDRAGGINGALLQMHAVRAVALARLRRPREAEQSVRVLAENRKLSFPSYIDTLLELDRFARARSAMLEMLEDKDYMQAVRLLQPSPAAFESPFDRRTRELRAALAQDERVQRALEGKGRVLDFEPVRLDPIDLPDLAPGLLPE